MNSDQLLDITPESEILAWIHSLKIYMEGAGVRSEERRVGKEC